MTFPVAPLPTDDAPRVSRRRRIARFFVTLTIVATSVTAASWWWSSRSPGNSSAGAVGTAYAAQADTLARAPKGVRVRVRVVNSTSVNGLAKRATSVLRDHGFDVVEYEGERRKSPREKTLVQTHTGHSDWSDRIIRVLGTGSAESQPDSSRYVDVTVLLGLDWKAPPQSFRP